MSSPRPQFKARGRLRVGGGQHLLYRGVRAVVILVDPHSFGGWRDTLGVQARLAELRVPTYLFQQGQSLPDALAHPTLIGAAVTR